MNKEEQYKEIEEKFKDVKEKTLALESDMTLLDNLVSKNCDKKAGHKFRNMNDHFFDMKSCMGDFERYFSQ